MGRAVAVAILLSGFPWPAFAQASSILKIRVTLLDAAHEPTPVPRHVLLVSDNPATAPPRRIVTGADGTVDVKLGPGSWTVESDQPAVLDGKAYQWTQTLTIVAGRDTTLELNVGNAEVVPVPAGTATAGTSPAHESSPLLSQWQDSVVALWTPTSRATGSLVDARGLVATSQHAIGNAKSVEVQLTPAVKLAGRLLVADTVRDVAVLWIDPKAVASVPPVPLGCDRAVTAPVTDRQEIVTIGAPLRGPKSAASGTASVEAHAILADFDLEPGSTGGPIFAADGGVVGITGVAGAADHAGRGDSTLVRVADVCGAVRAAEKAMRQATAPGGTHLPVEPARPFPHDALEEAAGRRAGGQGPYQMSSSDFDIAFITPVMTYAAEQRRAEAVDRERATRGGPPDAAQLRARLLTEFSNWSEYVADFPPVLLVRVTPRLVEGFWTKVARGAAQTQGVSVPPLKHFTSGFWRMRVLCGDAEVTPIHPFELEQQLSDTATIREGLYVFDPGALGPHCGTVKLVLYSEKEPAKGDTRVVAPAVVQQIWRDFAAWRAAAPAGDVHDR